MCLFLTRFVFGVSSSRPPSACSPGFEYSERTILGVNAASKWAQELAELNLAAVATPFYKGYKVGP